MQFMISGEIHADGHTFYIFESQNESINYKSLGQITDIENFSKECNFPILRAGNSYNKNRRIETQKGLFIYFDEKNSHNNNIDNLLIKCKVTRIGVMFNENGDSDEIKRDLEKYHYYNYNLYPDLVSKADYYKFEWKKGVVDKEL